jgi:8-oxo-dGTP diphosphatase/2-hydroxy-dATP diphosphatase
MKERTLVFLHKPDSKEILLAMKKRGFGKGKWNGVGGKFEEGESIEEAAIREALEEIGVKINTAHLDKRAEIDFIFKDKSDLDQYVHVFFVEKWEGEPTESEEMKPEWFHHDLIPYKEMWIDDEHWIANGNPKEKNIS